MGAGLTGGQGTGAVALVQYPPIPLEEVGHPGPQIGTLRHQGHSPPVEFDPIQVEKIRRIIAPLVFFFLIPVFALFLFFPVFNGDKARSRFPN